MNIQYEDPPLACSYSVDYGVEEPELEESCLSDRPTILLMGLRRSGKSSIQKMEDGGGCAYDKESLAIIKLNNTTVLYLKEVTKFLALVCILRALRKRFDRPQFPLLRESRP